MVDGESIECVYDFLQGWSDDAQAHLPIRAFKSLDYSKRVDFFQARLSLFFDDF